MTIIEVDIECGALTCAIEPGKFCKFVGTRRMGTEFVCRLFPTDDDSYTKLDTIGGKPNGWLARCPECLAHNQAHQYPLPHPERQSDGQE